MNGLDTRDAFESALKESLVDLDPLDTYDLKPISQAYIKASGFTGWAAQIMSDKYKHFQIKVDEKAASDESLSLYFANNTYDEFKRSFV